MFKDRRHAGKLMAAKLQKFAGAGYVVLALPRGGTPVAFEVAKALKAPLDVFIVRKLGVPDQPELAMGAIATGGVRILNTALIRSLEIPSCEIDAVTSHETLELARRERAFHGDRSAQTNWQKVILIDDGLATGATMLAAIVALRKLGCDRLVVGVPVSSPQTCASIGREVNEIVCAETPTAFRSVGQWYQNFTQTTDTEVKDLLEEAKKARIDAA